MMTRIEWRLTWHLETVDETIVTFWVMEEISIRLAGHVWSAEKPKSAPTETSPCSIVHLWAPILPCLLSTCPTDAKNGKSEPLTEQSTGDETTRSKAGMVCSHLSSLEEREAGEACEVVLFV